MTSNFIIEGGAAALLENADTKAALLNELTALRAQYQRIVLTANRQIAEFEQRVKDLNTSIDGALVLVEKFNDMIAELKTGAH